MRPSGVTNHLSRIVVDNASAVSDESFMAGTLAISDSTLDAVRGVLGCAPDHLIMGMSAVTFYGGAEGALRWRRSIEEACGMAITTGSEALAAGLAAIGGIRRLAFLSPYFPVANREVARFFSDHGYEVVRDVCLRCPTWTAIAEVPEARLAESLRELDGDDADALIQVGTNLSMLRLAARLEEELDKPVLAVNAATYWRALRETGIPDRLEGYGSLLARF